MAIFVVEVTTGLSPAAAWSALWDLRAHSRVIPLTRLSGDALAAPGEVAAALGVGSLFTATTALGPVRVHDDMRIAEWCPPLDDAELAMDDPRRTGRATVVKQGRVVRGRIDAVVAPARSGAAVRWQQEIGIAGLPRAVDPIVAAVARAAYGGVLRRLLAE